MMQELSRWRQLFLQYLTEMIEMNNSQTVAAISTAQGEGGIGVIRISGDDAPLIADRVFQSCNGRRLAEMKGYTAAFGKIIRDGEELDEAVALVFRAPHSYTGENVVELSCHRSRGGHRHHQRQKPQRRTSRPLRQGRCAPQENQRRQGQPARTRGAPFRLGGLSRGGHRRGHRRNDSRRLQQRRSGAFTPAADL